MTSRATPRMSPKSRSAKREDTRIGPRANQVAGLADAIAEIRPLGEPADALLHDFFRKRKAMGQRDRALIADGLFAYFRRRRSLEALAQSQHPRHLALAVLVRELGIAVRELENAIGSEDASWLREFKSHPATNLPEAVAADLPDWLWAKLGQVYGEDERKALAQAWLAAAPLDLRINPLKTTRDEARAALAASGIAAQPTPYSQLGLRVAGRPSLARHPLFAAGALEVQDEGSQILSFLVAPKRSEMVVDFCAGAGGKTLLLGALMRSQGRLYAFDTHDRRLANLKPRLARSGLSNVHPQWIAHERDTKVKRLAGKIDRVLVDAPCTGFGTLRRNPDLKWRQPESAVAELVAKQRSILAAASTLVKPGGRIVYATCSVLPEENDAVVAEFVAAHPTFERLDATAELARAGIELDTGPALKLLPHKHGCDGFYAEVLTRTA
jgi:16S rRNA (cytosine967-C5)-methyltransferase